MHQLSKLDTTKENFIDKKVLFQECLKQSTRKQVKGDSCIGVDGLTHSLNNLELLGKSASKVMQRNKTKEYCKNTKDNSTVDSTCANSGVVLGVCSEKSCTEAESGVFSSQSEEQYESCTSDNYESSNSSDSLNAYNIQHWSEEEALDYIRFLKKKIVKIEQVLKVRSESSSLDLQNNNSESLQGLDSNDTTEMSVKYDIKDTKHSKQRSKHNCPQKNTTKVSEVSEDASQTALPSDWNKSLGQLHSSLIDGQSHYARSLAAFKYGSVIVFRKLMSNSSLIYSLGNREKESCQMLVRKANERQFCDFFSKCVVSYRPILVERLHFQL